MESLDDRVSHKREQLLNPAYAPDYSEKTLRQATESMPSWTIWSPFIQRPLRDVKALSFLTNLEEIHLNLHTDLKDLTPFTQLPKLRSLTLGYVSSLHGGKACEDYTPLARCRGVRDLTLSFRLSLADSYNLIAEIYFDAVVFRPHKRDIANRAW